ncbi:LysE family transporter [Aestuariibacter sp. AA17]|uniref:LysE family transporter n=1 Tax=Fluctibacter corallii TaxID=2984329 RepID=A0ABT3A7C1_9ALTE|nr:LysE family transporter [Aestuariibacter sp. AA17]MCV2884221.1 LysE family transporter [Aestuariibacter sp. AA17]
MTEFLTTYWVEFATIAAVHLLAVASPGPDFAIVMKHSISHGRRAAMLTSIGIGLGIFIHVAYSLLGIGLIIKTTPWLFQALTYVAAAYLLYIGWGALRSPAPKTLTSADMDLDQSKILSDKKAFLVGLMTNGLNPKATLFFLSVFAVAVSPDTPNMVKLGYGVYLAFATGVWFCTLSFFLSSKPVRDFIGQKGYWFDRLMGSVLVLLAIKLVASS